MTRISVLIPNYNGEALIRRNLPAILSAISKEDEVIIVDDCSTDNSVAEIQKFEEVKLLRNEKNQGFARTINKAIESGNGQYALLLNSDMAFSSAALHQLLSFMIDHPDAFGVSPTIVDENGKPLEGLKQGRLNKFQIYLYNSFNVDQAVPTLYLCGGAALVNYNKLREIKGFSLLYEPFYYEDVDLSFKARQLGWVSYYEPNSEFVHQHSKTIGKYFDRKFIRSVSKQNRILFSLIYGKSTGLRILVRALSVFRDGVYRKALKKYKSITDKPAVHISMEKLIKETKR